MQTLVLNTYKTPISVVPSKRAVVLVLTQRAISLANYDDTLMRSAGSNFPSTHKNIVISMPIPSVIQCTDTDFIPRHYTKILPFNRRNVYIRDKGRCCYCDRKVSINEFSFDHVLAQSHGGQTTWENIVLACHRCNAKKGDRPVSKFKELIRKPYAPRLDKAAPAYLVNKIAAEIPHETWADFIYWSIILQP